MFLDNRQKELIKNAIKDYNFMKDEIEQKIERGYTLKEISDFICNFRDVEITNLEDYHSEYGYLDFYYKDVSMCVGFDKCFEEKKKRVNKGFQIYDKETYTYIIEDWLSVEEYEELMNTPKDEMLRYIISDLKYYESTGKSADYEECKEKIIKFLKEEF